MIKKKGKKMDRVCKAWLSSMVGLLILTSSVTAAPFPESVSRWSEADKLEQRTAADKLLKGLYAAVKAGDASFSVPKGVYRFSKTVNRRPTHINLNGVKNFTLEGNGSSFYFENFATAIQVYKSENLKIRNLVLDWDPLPFTQGAVVSIDHAKNTFVFRPDAGYEVLYDKLLKSDQIRGVLFDPKTREFKAGQNGFCLKIQEKLANGTYQVKVRGFYGYKAKKCGFENGDLIAIWARMGRAIKTEVSANIAYENITLYSAPFVGFVENVGKGGHAYRRCRIVKRPGTDRLMGGNADGFNCSNVLRGPHIEDCEIENIGDDFINIHGVYFRVFEQKSPTELIVQPFGTNGVDKPVLSFLENKTWNSRGSRSVLSRKAFTYTVPESNKGALERKWAAGSNYKAGQKIRAYEITLDRPLDLTAATIFSANTATSNHAVIKNCRFSGSLARGIRLQSEHTQIEGNTIQRCLGPGLTTGGQPGFWGEAVTSKNLVVRNNSFIACGLVGDGRLLGTVEITAPGTLAKGEPASTIEFTGNRITRPGIVGLHLNNCRDVTVTGNTFSEVGVAAPFGKRKTAPPILVEDVESVKISDNTFVKSGQYATKNDVQMQD
jgi:hypothetical protein